MAVAASLRANTMEFTSTISHAQLRSPQMSCHQNQMETSHRDQRSGHLKLSNLFVVNEHTDGANTALMKHEISSLTILTLVRAERHRTRKKHSDSDASSLSPLAS